MRFPRLLLILIGLALLAGLLYQNPAVNNRLAWRIDGAWAYLRGVFLPVADAPTPIAGEIVATEASLVFPTATPRPPTAVPQPSPTFIPSSTPLPGSITLNPPRWEKQDWNNCGPATMAIYLRYYGWGGDQYTISDDVKPERTDRNVNVEELAFWTRNNAGWLVTQYRVGGDLTLLQELLANGFPVMIEEGYYLETSYWPDDDRWAGHYLLLTGYDAAAQTFTGQDSFEGANRTVSFAQLDEGWRAFNRVYILLYLPEQEPLVQAILGKDWDPDTARENALAEAQAEAAANPNDGYAWFNVGTNLVYFERYAEAADAFDAAREAGLPQRMFRYQFGPFFAYFHSNRIESLMSLTEYTLINTPNSEEALLWRGWGYYRLGETAKAIAYFKDAYYANPNSPDAVYALDFMGASP